MKQSISPQKRKIADYRRIILITGASRGIGRCTAMALATPEDFVAINYKSNKTEANKTKRMLRKKGISAEIYQCDITDRQCVEEMIAHIEAQYGRIDVLVNNAGDLMVNYFLMTNISQLDYLIKTNFLGAVYCVESVLPYMKKNVFGKIVNISSVITVKTVIGSAAYAVSKAMLNSYTRQLAKETMPYNITANAVLSGFVQTDMTAVYRPYSDMLLDKERNETIGMPEAIAHSVAYFVNEPHQYVTGQLLVVDGGVSL